MSTGLWREGCELLRCIEYFKCCKMTTEAKFSIVVKDMKKRYTKKCTMKVHRWFYGGWVRLVFSDSVLNAEELFQFLACSKATAFVST